MSGKDLRIKRIFKKENALILAFDHGMGIGPQKGLVNPEVTISKCIDNGIDAVLTSPGIADMYSELFSKIGLIIRLDGGFTFLKGGIDRAIPCFTVEHALRIGCDAVACMGFIGGNDMQEKNSLQALSHYVESCAYWQIPLMAEMVVLNFEKPNTTASVAAALAARTGVEYGADFIKTPYISEGDEFKKVTNGSFKPVLILGGEKVTDVELLTSVKKAMCKGARGAVIGRNIWQHENPDKICQALSLIVHQGVDVDKAIQLAGCN